MFLVSGPHIRLDTLSSASLDLSHATLQNISMKIFCSFYTFYMNCILIILSPQIFSQIIHECKIYSIDCLINSLGKLVKGNSRIPIFCLDIFLKFVHYMCYKAITHIGVGARFQQGGNRVFPEKNWQSQKSVKNIVFIQ